MAPIIPSKDALNDAYDYVPCGLLTATPDGVIQRVNATLCDWLKVSAEDLVQLRRVQDLLTMGGRVYFQTHVVPMMKLAGAVAELMLDLRLPEGKKLPVLVNARRRQYGSVEIDEFVFVVVNDRHKYEQEILSARQRADDALQAQSAAEAALRLADRRKDEFLAMLAHELRNPLAPIQSVVKILQQKHYGDPQFEWSRDVLSRQVRQMARLVDDLLDATRVVEGKLELRTERINLNAAINEAIEGSQGLITSLNHVLVVSMPGDVIYLVADAGRVVQIVQNLLNNAAKYTPRGGKITLTVVRESRNASISVSDNGIGIAAEHLPLLFTTFTQLPEGASRSSGGLGIGLSLVKALAEQLGGSVSVTSRGAGLGSEFVVYLPLLATEAPQAVSTIAKVIVGSSRQRRILIIDDSEDAASSLAMLLDMDGHSVTTAADGKSGLQAIAEFAPDVVLLDIGLPDISGYDLARQIRADLAINPMTLIAVTGYGQASDIDAAKSAGFDSHLVKPVSYDRLLELLRA